MKDQIRLLLDLQEVDEAIAEARLRQRKYPEQVEAELTSYRLAESELNKTREALAAHEALRRDREGQLADQEANLNRLKTRLKDITNTREYQAYIQEMDTIERTVSQLEDQVLQTLSDIESCKAQLAACQVAYDDQRQVYDRERVKVDAELARIEKEIVTLLGDREARAKALDAPLLKRYERVVQVVRRPVVGIKGRSACSGCNVNIPPQLVTEVKRGGAVHQCPYCHRILFLEEQLQPQGA